MNTNTSTTKTTTGRVSKRCNNHTSSFTEKSYQKVQFFNYIWELKENVENYAINWLIAIKAHPYICGTRECDLFV